MTDDTPPQDQQNQYPIDPLLNQAVQWQESRDDPNAVGPNTKGGNAVGSMQTMPGTLRDPGYGVAPAKNDSPEERKRVGDDYLQAMNNKYKGNTPYVLAAYNHGPTATDAWIANGADPKQLPPETQDYIHKITQHHQQLMANQLPVGTQVASNDPNFAPQAETDPDIIMMNATAAKEKAQAVKSGASPQVGVQDPDIQLMNEHAAKEKAAQIAKEAPPAASTTAPPLVYQLAQAAVNDPYSLTPAGLMKTAGNALYDTAKGGVENAGKFANDLYRGAQGDFSSPPTPETVALQNKLQAGTATRQDKEAAFLSEVSNSPGGHFTGAVAGLVPAMNVGSTIFNKLINPGIQHATGVSPEDLQTGELLGGTALGAKYAPEFAGKSADLTKPVMSMANELTGKAAEASPDQIIAGFSNKPPPGGGGGGGGPIDPNSINAISPIPGVQRTLAQATGDPGLAQLERTMQSKDNGPLNAVLENNAKARQKYFTEFAGTPESVAADEAVREAKVGPLYKTAAVQPLNPEPIQPILADMDSAIVKVGKGSNAGKRLIELKGLIQGALPTAGDEAAGIPPENPTQSPLIQIYREERDQLAKTADKPGAYSDSVSNEIQPIWHNLGAAIESQSPEFAEAQQTYRDMSPAITASKYLQGLRLTDSDGNMTKGSVNNVFEGMKKLQTSAPSYHAIHSVSPEQMQGMQNLRDDLRAESNSGKGKAFGSNSVQNVEAVNKLNNLYPGTGLTHNLSARTLLASGGAGLGGYLAGPWGSAAGAYLGERAATGLGKFGDVRRENALTSLNNKMMDAQGYKNYLLQNLSQ